MLDVLFRKVSKCSLALNLSAAILDDRVSSVGLELDGGELDGLSADRLSSCSALGHPRCGRYEE